MTFYKLTFPTILISFLFLGLIGSPSLADTKKPKTTPPPDPRVLIKAVDAANNQVTLVHMRNKQENVYKIDSFTQVTIDNKPGSINDIKAGQQVFAYVERDNDTLDSIGVGLADPAPVAPK